MLRRILSVLAGIVVFGIVVMLFDEISHQMYPMPEGMAVDDKQGMADYIAAAPFSAMLVVTLGWILGAFAGAFTSVRIATDQHRLVAGIVGGVAFAGTAANLFMLPHPVWMAAAGLAGIAVAAHLAWKLGAR